MAIDRRIGKERRPIKISMQAMSVDVFISMLTSLSEILDKGAEHAQAADLDLINARLAPDMYPLSQQVRIACDQARNGVARITARRRPSARPRTRPSTISRPASRARSNF